MSANTAAVQKLMNKSSSYAEAIEDLDKILKEMEENIRSGQTWASWNVFFNATLLPLNIIVSGLTMGAVSGSAVSRAAPSLLKEVYKKFATKAYDKFSAPGTRISKDNSLMADFATVKKYALDAAKVAAPKAAPAIGLFMGMVEDTVALQESAEALSDIKKTGDNLRRNIVGKIKHMRLLLIENGILLSQELEKINLERRTV